MVLSRAGLSRGSRRRVARFHNSRFTGFYWVLLDLTGFYWVLLGLTGFDWVLLGFAEFFSVLPGFKRILLDFTELRDSTIPVFLGFTEFSSVLPGINGFYWILLRFTRFYGV